MIDPSESSQNYVEFLTFQLVDVLGSQRTADFHVFREESVVDGIKEIGLSKRYRMAAEEVFLTKCC